MLANDPSIIYCRGPLGELPIHQCHLIATMESYQIADQMIQLDPSLVTQRYSEGPYEGENLLHIATVNNQTEVVRYFATNFKPMMDNRATGSFFQQVSVYTGLSGRRL